jgi:Glycosyl transferase family 2
LIPISAATSEHIAGVCLFGFIACFWIFYALRVAYGALRLPWLKDFSPAEDAHCPRITLLFAARNEEEKLPGGLAKLAALDYPKLEIIAVDDRSTDKTGAILDEVSRQHPRLRVVHVADLPTGWLGKPHALQSGYEQSTGEWLLFTDADVHFALDSLRRAISLISERKLDHLTLLGDVEMHGFWEKTALTFFGMAFQLATDPYRAAKPRSPAYVGVGAFQMVKRAAYEAVGTHRRLAMEVVDDMRLGKLIKRAGFRSCVGIAGAAVTVRWHAGLHNIVGGVTKNFFAAAGYSLATVLVSVAGVLATSVVPFVAVLATTGWVRLLAAVAAVIALGFHAGVSFVMRASPMYALTHPLGAAIFCYMLLRSTVVTIWNGGVTWRGTFYPLEELRRGMV